MLYPLSLMYLIGYRLKTSWDIMHQKRANCFVISVGNLTAGGSGKTPFTIALVKFLIKQGYQVAVSHRGYRGKYESSTKVVKADQGLVDSPVELGDEAYLLAQNLPEVPVAVGKYRHKAIEAILKQYPNTQIVVLDDSLQNKRLHHDLDIVLISAEHGFGNGFLLPAGYLREPVSSLNKDMLCIVISKEKDRAEDQVYRMLEDRLVKAHTAKTIVRGLYSYSGEALIKESLRGAKFVICSGLGNPYSFEAMVINEGIRFEKHFIYHDHFDYVCIDEMKSYMQNHQIDYLICTQKDLIKLACHEELRPKLISLEIAVIAEDRSLWDQLKELLPTH